MDVIVRQPRYVISLPSAFDVGFDFHWYAIDFVFGQFTVEALRFVSFEEITVKFPISYLGVLGACNNPRFIL